MGSNFGDIDNDGFLDIYLGTGSPSYVSLAPSMLLRNKNGTSFVDVTVSSGTGEMHKGHGVAFADLDNDGDEDIAFKVGGATPGDAHAFRLFENPGHANDWLGLNLVGVRIESRRHRRENQGHGRERRRRRAARFTARSTAAGPSAPRRSSSTSVSARPRASSKSRSSGRPAGRVRCLPMFTKNQVIEIREMDDRFTTLDRKPLAAWRTSCAVGSHRHRRVRGLRLLVSLELSRGGEGVRRQGDGASASMRRRNRSSCLTSGSRGSWRR